MYKLAPLNTLTNTVTAVIRTSDDLHIPIAPENRHYQEYLKWVAEGNTPLPADE
jgi:hypothetical protein